MARREALLRGLELVNTVGIEIGPLDKPIVRSTDGPVLYLDYLSTDQLREKYVHDPAVNLKKLVNVDIVCSPVNIGSEIPSHVRADYIVASHVIEHVPDVLSWLEALRAVLKPGGEIRLVVPDRRFTFDYLRAETRLCDIVNAYLLKATAPLAHSIIDHCYNMVGVDVVEAWSGTLDKTTLEHYHTPAGALAVARDAIENGTYHDVHCWVFTPRSFATLFAQAATLNLISYECRWIQPTARFENEFYVNLGECGDTERVLTSWHAAAEALADPPLEPESTPSRLHVVARRVRAKTRGLAQLARNRRRGRR